MIMEYLDRIKEFGGGPSDEQIAAQVETARETALRLAGAELYALCFSCLDITTLGAGDSERTVGELARKVVGLGGAFPGLGAGAASGGTPGAAACADAGASAHATARFAVPAKHAAPASVCVYPRFVDTVGVALGDSDVRITSVAGGFPAAQTYLEVKMLEVAMAVENGADEVDVVMNVGEVLEGNWDVAGGEIETLRQEVGDDVTLKVIIESGMLPTAEHVRRASLVAALAGADFVKTSTGKAAAGATPEAAVAICTALRDFHRHTGRRVGFKVAGGVRTRDDAALYAAIVYTVLGVRWFTPSLLRFGASSLADDLLGALTGQEVNYFG
jgi:deoxyribose-phosphate aldolase